MLVERTYLATPETVRRFAEATGDWNPIHFDAEAARRAGLSGPCAHGLLVAGWAGLLAAESGASVRKITARFEQAVPIGSVVRIRLEKAGWGFRWTARGEGGELFSHGEIRMGTR